MSDTHQFVCPSCLSLNRVPVSRLGDRPICGKCKQALFPQQPVELTDSNFQRFVEKTDALLIVDFWAEWCGPCRMMAPQFAEAASQLEPPILLAKVNTEAARYTSDQFGIVSLPTLVALQGGEEFARQPGAMNTQQIIHWVRSIT